MAAWGSAIAAFTGFSQVSSTLLAVAAVGALAYVEAYVHLPEEEAPLGGRIQLADLHDRRRLDFPVSPCEPSCVAARS